MERTYRPKRLSVEFAAIMTASDGHQSTVTVRDLSAAGFRIVGDDELFVGERIKLQVEKESPVSAIVKWTRGSEAGGLFVDDLQDEA